MEESRHRHDLKFILSLGRALHTHGYPANRLEEVLGRVTRRLGLTGQFFSTPTSLFAAFGPEDDQQTFLLRVTPGNVNLGRLADLDKVTIGVLRGTTDAVEGAARIEQVLSEPREYPWWLTVPAYAAASAAASRILSGGLKEIGVSAVIGLLIGLLMILNEKTKALNEVFEPFAATAASALAVAINVIIGPFALSNTILAGLITLIPGLTLTVAMVELSTNHLSSGTARLNRAFVAFMGLGFGAAIGGLVMGLLLGEPRTIRVVQLPGWTEWIALSTMPLALTILLRAHLRDAIWILIAAMLAAFGSRIGVKFLGPEMGVFLGSLIVGVASSWYARLLDRPAIIAQVPGILLLVPGSVGFRGLTALLDEKVVSGIDTTFKMIITAVALVAGTLIASVIAPLRREI